MLQLCPRCQIPMVEGTCPRCGSRPGQKEKASQPGESAPASQPPIQFEMMVPAETPKTPKPVNWKEELKKRLDQRIEKSEDANKMPKEGEEEVSETKSPSEPSPELRFKLEPESEPEPEETTATLFKYKLDRALRSSVSSSKPPSFSQPGKDPHVFEKPLAHRKPVRPIQQPPGQRTLHLKSDVPIARRSEDEIQKAVVEEEEPRISREILFSRFLSGIVDLVVPILTGFVFTIVASFLLGSDLLSPSSIKWIGLFALSFFLFNSVFFFMTSGQTPGMVITDLRLASAGETEEISTLSILLRTVVFLPSALTLIGLGWALFDPMCRCLHDLISRTRIEPLS